MRDDAALREALAKFLGEAQYRTFVRQGTRRGRLRYWQEQAWGEFVAAHPEHAIDADELSVALKVCYLHGDELRPKTVEVINGCMDYSPQFNQALRDHFPHAGLPVSTEGQSFEGDTAEILYCPACEKAASEWAANNP